MFIARKIYNTIRIVTAVQQRHLCTTTFNVQFNVVT